MIRFTGSTVHITTMPNKTISQEYKIFSMPEKIDVWEFHPSSNALGRDPIDEESHLLQHTDVGNLVRHVLRCLNKDHRNLLFKVSMDNFLKTHPLLVELHQMGI
jgi:hypothetical protein